MEFYLTVAAIYKVLSKSLKHMLGYKKKVKSLAPNLEMMRSDILESWWSHENEMLRSGPFQWVDHQTKNVPTRRQSRGFSGSGKVSGTFFNAPSNSWLLRTQQP